MASLSKQPLSELDLPLFDDSPQTARQARKMRGVKAAPPAPYNKADDVEFNKLFPMTKQRVTNGSAKPDIAGLSYGFSSAAQMKANAVVDNFSNGKYVKTIRSHADLYDETGAKMGKIIGTWMSQRVGTGADGLLTKVEHTILHTDDAKGIVGRAKKAAGSLSGVVLNGARATAAVVIDNVPEGNHELTNKEAGFLTSNYVQATPILGTAASLVALGIIYS
jgi:hypothetical protein